MSNTLNTMILTFQAVFVILVVLSVVLSLFHYINDLCVLLWH